MTIRAAVVGTGFGTRIHVPGLRLAGAEVVAISSRRRERAEGAARAAGIPAAFDDAARMLDAVRPDLVCIATPPAAHLEAVRAAAGRGVHVICEKPLAFDAAQAWEMAALADGVGIVNATDFQFRYWPGRARFYELVRQGVLGELRLLRYVWTAPMRLDPADPPFNWFAQEELGGGVLYNLGAHFYDFVRWCFGEVRAATGTLSAFVAERPLPDGTMARVTADDTASTELRLESGALVTAQFGFVTAGRRICIEAYGSAGTLILEDDLRLTVARGPDGAPAAVAVPAADPPEPKPLAPFVLLARDVIARIRDGDGGGRAAEPSILPTFADGARTQEIIDAVRFGAREGRWCDVRPIRLPRFDAPPPAGAPPAGAPPAGAPPAGAPPNSPPRTRTRASSA
jgi:predicted dehydrogenase